MSLHGLLGINPVSSGVLTTSQGLSSGITARREGVYNLEFPKRGFAYCVPWEQIAKIEVHADRGEFHLHNGMIGYTYHDANEASDRDWYIKVEGMLGLWAFQSGEYYRLRDGRMVYQLAIPRIHYKCRTKKDAAWSDKYDGRGTQMIIEEKPTMGYHDELWAEVREIRAAMAAAKPAAPAPVAVPASTNIINMPERKEVHQASRYPIYNRVRQLQQIQGGYHAGTRYAIAGR